MAEERVPCVSSRRSSDERRVHPRPLPELLTGVRGAERQPGEFRVTQNWIGAGNAPLAQAAFVPSPAAEMSLALDNFERFLHDEQDLPVLIHCGLAHAQFETIHPFLDGNGRVGRLLITFLLVHRGVLHRPLLYVSHHLKRRRAEYYDRLMAIREDGDREGWLRFFLRGVAETAAEATRTGRAIADLREQDRALVQERGLGIHGLRLVDVLYQRPLLNVNVAKDALGVTFRTAGRLIEELEHLGLLRETTGGRRNRRYAYDPYVRLFVDQDPSTPASAPVQATEGGL